MNEEGTITLTLDEYNELVDNIDKDTELSSFIETCGEIDKILTLLLCKDEDMTCMICNYEVKFNYIDKVILNVVGDTSIILNPHLQLEIHHTIYNKGYIILMPRHQSNVEYGKYIFYFLNKLELHLNNNKTITIDLTQYADKK